MDNNQDSNENVICPICNGLFQNNYFLSLHKTQKHNSQNGIPCSICGFIVKNKRHFKGHIKMHTNSERYNCNQCGKEIKRLDNLIRHNESHNNIVHICPICGKGFSRKDNLRRHSKVHKNVI